VISRHKAEERCSVYRGINSDRTVISEALAFAEDAVTYELIGFSIAFFLTMTHSHFAGFASRR
jgi:hypothetical protein